nr:otubain-like domain motif-containing [Pandoravirus massiliensis]
MKNPHARRRQYRQSAKKGGNRKDAKKKPIGSIEIDKMHASRIDANRGTSRKKERAPLCGKERWATPYTRPPGRPAPTRTLPLFFPLFFLGRRRACLGLFHCRCRRCVRLFLVSTRSARLMRATAARPRPSPTVDPNDHACTSATGLPSWMLSECADEEEAAHVRSVYRLARTASNGDCLFHSVRLGLLSVPGSGAPTSARLRQAVARTVLDRGDRAALAALVQWRDILCASRDPDLLRDYGHARALVGEAPPFSDRARRLVYEAMCDARTYWGDDYAVAALERIVGVAIIVVARSGGGAGRCRGRLTGSPGRVAPTRWHIVLCLDGAHYQPLVRCVRRRRVRPRQRDRDHNCGGGGGHSNNVNNNNGSVNHDRHEPERPAYVSAFGERVPRFMRRSFSAVATDAATVSAARAVRRTDPLGR